MAALQLQWKYWLIDLHLSKCGIIFLTLVDDKLFFFVTNNYERIIRYFVDACIIGALAIKYTSKQRHSKYN